MLWLERLLRMRSFHKSDALEYKEVRVGYDGKSIAFDPTAQTISYRNYISPTDGWRTYPEGYFEKKTEQLSEWEAQQCDAAIKAVLPQLPFSDHVDILPPGATSKFSLTCTKQDDSVLRYSDTHLASGGYSVTSEPIPRGALALFYMLSTFCDFPKQTFYVPKKPQLLNGIDPQFFEEILWMCPECSAVNFIDNASCAKCGARRRWR